MKSRSETDWNDGNFRLSAGRGRLYESCPAKYPFRYGAAALKALPNIYMKVGTVLHAAIEAAALQRLEDDSQELLQIPEMVERVATAAVELGIEEAGKVRCLEIARSIRSLSLRNVLQVEAKFDLPVMPGLNLFGFIDLIRGSSAVVEVIDWKTGAAPPPTEEEHEVDIQVGFYLWAARRMYPDAKEIVATFVYLAHNDRMTVEWTPERDRYFEAVAKAIYRGIQDERFEARVGEACNFCDYKSRCPAFVSALESYVNMPGQERPEFAPMSNDEIVNLRYTVGNAAKQMDSYRKDLDEAIKLRLPIDSEMFTVRQQSRSMPKVDHDGIRAVAGALDRDPLSLSAEVSKVSYSKLAKLATSPAALAALDEHTVNRQSANYLNVRMKK